MITGAAPAITREQKIAELELEIEMRRKVYWQRVKAKKMKLETAALKTRIMREILADYQRQNDLFSIGEKS